MNEIPTVFWLVPIASVVALGMAWYFFSQMMKAEEGTQRMIEIAEHVRKGAMAYLKQQYKVVFYVFIVLALVFAFMAYVLKVDRKSTRLNSSHANISYAVFCLKKKKD